MNSCASVGDIINISNAVSGMHEDMIILFIMMFLFAVFSVFLSIRIINEVEGKQSTLPNYQEEEL